LKVSSGLISIQVHRKANFHSLMALHDQIQRMITLLNLSDFLTPMQIQLLNTLLSEVKGIRTRGHSKQSRGRLFQRREQ
jgi:hypothetical protein